MSDCRKTLRWLLATVAVPIVFLSNTAPAAPQTVELQSAELSVVADGEAATTARITLPLDWDLAYRGRSGRAELRVVFARPAGMAEPNELYMLFFRSIGNAYEIELNGSVLATGGSLTTAGDRWTAKQPVGMFFPSSLLSDRNELTVRMRADAGRRAGVAPILLGPAAELEPLRARAHRSRVIPTLLASLLALLVAVFSLVLWLQHRERLYAWACIAEALWAVIVFDVILEWAPLTWPAWGYTIPILLAVWICALQAIVEQVFEQRPPFERLAIRLVAGAIVPCVVIAAVTQSPLAIEIWRGLSATAVAALALRLLSALRTQFSVERVLLTAGILALYAAALYDAFASKLRAVPFSDSYWGEYAGTFLGLTIMWAVSKRFQQARADTDALRESLAKRIADKESDLRKSFERLAVIERAQAALAERERILRDMHDGVGAKLSSVMRKLESGQSRREDIALALRESLDRLKLSIDAMSLPPGDVNALLASLRYRLQARIANAGIELEWDVGELPSWQGGTDMAMRRLQFLLLDTLSGILESSQASRLRLSAHFRNGKVELSLLDNGDRALLAQRFKALYEHADAIGAKLAMTADDAPPGLEVRVRVWLPA